MLKINKKEKTWPSSTAIQTEELNLWYNSFQALTDINLDVKKGIITSLIGPSGCGKSTLLRCFNRINERLPYVQTSGKIKILSENIYTKKVDPTRLRKHVGMIFQRPNPLPISIRDNVLFGHSIHERENKTKKSERDEIVENSLKKVLLWDKVKDKLKKSALGLSLEEKQKLCIARLLPVQPFILLMDEPCSALDPKGTEAIENLICELKGQYTILIVTHNMAQAKRVSDECIFMLMGKVEEQSSTEKMFLAPTEKSTLNYIEGRYG